MLKLKISGAMTLTASTIKYSVCIYLDPTLTLPEGEGMCYETGEVLNSFMDVIIIIKIAKPVMVKK